jgi:hypothetical protein
LHPLDGEPNFMNTACSLLSDRHGPVALPCFRGRDE